MVYTSNPSTCKLEAGLIYTGNSGPATMSQWDPLSKQKRPGCRIRTKYRLLHHYTASVVPDYYRHFTQSNLMNYKTKAQGSGNKEGTCLDPKILRARSGVCLVIRPGGERKDVQLLQGLDIGERGTREGAHRAHHERKISGLVMKLSGRPFAWHMLGLGLKGASVRMYSHTQYPPLRSPCELETVNHPSVGGNWSLLKAEINA